MLVGSSEHLSLLDPLISVAIPVFARLGHLLEVKVSIRVIILSATGNQSRYKGKTVGAHTCGPPGPGHCITAGRG